MANIPLPPVVLPLPPLPPGYVPIVPAELTVDRTRDIIYAIYKALGGTLMVNQIPEKWYDRTDDILDAILQLITAGSTSLGAMGTYLVSGNVTWLNNLKFHVTPCEYYINSVHHNSPAVDIILDPADPANPRIDVIYVNAAGVAGKITGVPAANPQKPLVDPMTQLELTFVNVAAGAAVPTNFVNEIIYREHVPATEWATSGYDPVDFDNVADAQQGVKSIFANYFYSLIFSFLKGSVLHASDYTTLLFYIKLTEQDPGNLTVKHMRIAFMMGGTVVNGNYVLSAADGFNENLFGAWQLITIPLSQMAFTSQNFDTILFRTDMNAKFRMDNILLQGAPDTCCGGNGGANGDPTIINSQLNNPYKMGVYEDPSGDGSLTLTKQ